MNENIFNSKALRQKVASMSDMELYTFVYTICQSAGFDSKRTAALTSDVASLRKTLLSLSDKQIETLLGKLLPKN